ncbi:MAG TPA: hypothetical protein VFO18_02825 [Methylomirabilota bacterium]|nr:hypothetical protein [Methylomirabilota bacterium]
MANYTKLRTQRDLRAARHAFHALFRNGLSCDQPVLHPGSGVILWGIRNEFTEEQYRILTDTAMAEGDTEAYVSFLGGYKGDNTSGGELPPDFELADHLRFELNLYPPRDLGDDWWRIIEHVIYSPRGTWGVMTSLELHGIAVGSAAFRSRFLASPLFADSLPRFLAYWKDARDRIEGRTSWVPTLLENVYGIAEAETILREFGEPRHTWSRNG